MKRDLKIRKVFLICLLLTLTTSEVYAREKAVRIGFLGDFSDVSKSYTRNMYKAAQMAVNTFNASGGLFGKPIRMIKIDAGNDPQSHYEHATTLATTNKVVAIFGGASTPCVLKASEACKEQQIPYLVSIGNSPSIVVENGHPYVFLFQPNSWMETKGFSIFVTLMPWQRYAWVGPDYSWGRSVLRDFKYHFEKIGAPIEWTAEAWHPLGTTDYKAIIRQIQDGNPDALVIGSWGEDVRNFIIQAKSQGLFDKVAIFGWFTYNMTGDMGRIVPAGMWNLARGGPFNHLADKFPQSKNFVKRFAKKFNVYPNGYTICCYDSMIAWRQAVIKAKTANPITVSKALKGLEFVGLRGKSFIRAVDGQMNCPTYFGKLVFTPEYPFAVWKSVVEIPAEKTWLPEKEVLSRRAKPRP
ncbi:ABC transporter substrate-binding protein [Thermodesulfobacteriota bacterium]